jgi:hypothetical protein
MINYINEIVTDQTIFTYMSTHDSVIYPLAYKLNNYELIKLPDYCSSIRIEVWSDLLRIYYDELLIQETCDKIIKI